MVYKYKALKIKGKRIDEHRLLMEQKLGRKLSFNEIVHHKNGNKKDNHLRNLELKNRSLHSKEFMKQYMQTKEGKKRLKYLKPYWFKLTKFKDGKYWCNHCKKFLPKSSFWKCPSRKINIRAHCISCEKQLQNNRHHNSNKI